MNRPQVCPNIPLLTLLLIGGAAISVGCHNSSVANSEIETTEQKTSNASSPQEAYTSAYSFDDAEVQQAYDHFELLLMSRETSEDELNSAMADLFSIDDNQLTSAFQNAFSASVPSADRWSLIYTLSLHPSPSSCDWAASFLMGGLQEYEAYQAAVSADEDLRAHDPRKPAMRVVLQFVTNLLKCERANIEGARNAFLEIVANEESHNLRRFALLVGQRHGTEALQSQLPDFAQPQDNFLLGITYGPDTLTVGNTTMTTTTPSNLPIPPLNP